MKNFNLLPSSSDIKNMSYLQWLYCYMNIIKDEEEDDKKWRDRIKYAMMFVNEEGVKKVTEMEMEQEDKTKLNNSSELNKKYKNKSDDSYFNDTFDQELKEAMKDNKFFAVPDNDTIRGNPDMSSSDFVEMCLNDYNNLKKEDNLDIIEIDE